MTISRLATYKIADPQTRTEIEDYIAAIEDPQTREMFELHFLRGLSYSQTAREIKGKISCSCVKMRIARRCEKKL